MFDLHTFLMDTIHSMIGKEPEYKVRQYALGWLEKGVLTQDDLAAVEEAYAARETAQSGTERDVLAQDDLADVDQVYVAQETAQNASEFTEEG